MLKVYFENDELDMIERIQDNLGFRFMSVNREVIRLDDDHAREFIVIETESETLKSEIEQFRDMERLLDYRIPVSV
jgi:hypothetical protein